MYCYDLTTRAIYWSDIGSYPPTIKKASMDGSSELTVVSLYNANVDNTLVFTLDYSQQMLYWINGSNNCSYDTHHIGSANSDGSGKRIFYSHGYYCYSITIDFFGGAVYSITRNDGYIFKAVLKDTPEISYYYVNYDTCTSYYMYTKIKVIAHQRQLQGTGQDVSAHMNACCMCSYIISYQHSVLQASTLVPSTMVAVLIFVFSVLVMQETTHVLVIMGHNSTKMDTTALVRQLVHVLYSA